MRIVDIQQKNQPNTRIDGAYVTDASVDLLSDKLVNLYLFVQHLRPDQELTIVMDFHFLSARSRSVLARFFKGLSKWCTRHRLHRITIEWRYHFEDEDLEEFGEILEAMTDLRFHFVQTEAEHSLRAV